MKPTQETFHKSQNNTKQNDETLTARDLGEPFFLARFDRLEAQLPAQNDTPSPEREALTVSAWHRSSGPLRAKEQALGVSHAGSA